MSNVAGSEILNFVLSLVFVVCTIVVLGWLYSRSRSLGASNPDMISVIATRALGSKERLLVVDVAGRQLLVGITASNVQTLHVFDEPVDVPKAAATSGPFGRRLREFLAEMRQ